MNFAEVFLMLAGIGYSVTLGTITYWGVMLGLIYTQTPPTI